MQSRRAGALALGISLAGVVLVVLVIGLAAQVGPSGLTHGQARDGLFHAHPVTATTSPPPVNGHPQRRALPHGGSSLPFAGLIGWLIRLALVGWVLWLAFRALKWLDEERRARREHELSPLDIDFDVLDDPEPIVEAIRADADAQMELLLSGTPRNAIVASWERFEEQAERIGLARKSWETSSEFTLRLLDAAAADSEAVQGLAALFREARFSEHEITETHRQQAIAALQRIRETVGTERVGRR